jgi:hypothetical protein
MQGRSGGKVSARLARAAQRLADWRRTRPKGARIPEPLWKLATELAQTEGLWRTARTLRLDYYQLKKRVDAATDQSRAAKPGKHNPTFVELAPSLVAMPGKCMIELEQGDGSRMRIHLEGCRAPDLVALCNSFWSDLG